MSAGKSLEGGGLEIVMPEMGESVTEGTVLEWHVSEGDAVEEGETVVEVSTDKVDAEVPAPASGTITKILVGPDETIEVGKPLAEMTEGRGARVTVRRRRNAGADRGGDAGSPGAAPRPRMSADGARATPVARRVAAGERRRPERRQGLGRRRQGDQGGRARGASGDGKPRRRPPPLQGEAKPLRGPAAMLAKAMDESRSIPTATSFRTLAVDTLDAKRKALNGVLKERGMKVSFTHLIAWAIVKAAQEWPVMGRVLRGDRRQAHRRSRRARSTSGSRSTSSARAQRSLMVPCIKGADSLDFAGFHSYYEELITKTRENKLTADDFQGTNITLTNPGGHRHHRLGAAPDERARARSSPAARSPTRSSGRTPRRRRSRRSASRR